MLSGGFGNFGGEITGQMIEVPGQPARYRSVGAGATWRAGVVPGDHDAPVFMPRWPLFFFGRPPPAGAT